jgi:hypothetical protein
LMAWVLVDGGRVGWMCVGVGREAFNAASMLVSGFRERAPLNPLSTHVVDQERLVAECGQLLVKQLLLTTQQVVAAST